MATAAEVQTAYKAIVRADLNAATAQALADAINNGTTTLAAYEASLIAQNASTTGAAVAIASFVTGVAPTSEKLDALKVAADAQVAAYTKAGVANPALGAFEAFGKSFASDASTGFAAKYGSLSASDFVNTVYVQVYGTTPSTAAAANLNAQVAYFTALYTAAGISAADAALQAKGAVMGQIVGYAFTDPSAAGAATIDNQVAAFLTNAANGDTTGYGKALPPASGTGNPGAILTLTNAASGDVIDPSQTVLSLKSTDGDDTIRGLGAGDFNSADVINAGKGFDTINAVIDAATVAAALTSVERVNIKSTAATAKFDGSASSGLQQVWSDGSTAAFTIDKIGLSTTVGIRNTDQAVTANFNNVTGTADVANLALDGAKAGSSFTANGIETVRATVSSTSATTIDGDKVAAIEVSGKGSLVLGVGAAADDNLASVKASGLTGDFTLNLAEQKDITVTGSSGINLITLTGGKKATVTTFDGNDNITTGAGDDTIVTGNGTNVVNAGDGKNTVTGGDGNDTITTGTGDDTIVTGNGTNVVNAGDGVNKVTGGSGDDTIVTGAGKDTIVTGDGVNSVTAGGEADSITLGAGKDTVIYTAAADSISTKMDSVTAFTSGTDKLDVKAVNTLDVFASAGKLNALQAAVNALAADPSKTVTDVLTASLGAGADQLGANETGYFSFKGDTYVVVNDATAALGAGDLVVKLVGITSVTTADIVIA